MSLSDYWKVREPPQSDSTLDPLLNHSLGSKTGFSMPLPTQALAHFSCFPPATQTLFPLPGRRSLPSSGRPSRLPDPAPSPKPRRKSQQVRGSPEPGPGWPAPGTFRSPRRRRAAPAPHRVPPLRWGEAGSASGGCFPVPFPRRPSSWLWPRHPRRARRET